MKHILYNLLMILPLTFLFGCNQEDDINEIFANGQTWHWSSSYNTTNWEDNNKFTDCMDKNEKEQINKNQDAYIIKFNDDGSIEGKGSTFTFTGQWNANGSDHSFFINIKVNQNPSGLDKIFHDDLTQARFYRGDSRILKLFNDAKNHYIQFYPVGSIN